MKATSGPWKAQKPPRQQHAIDRKWEIVALVKGGGEQVIVGEHTGIDCLTEANARLIAAVPELLEAAQRVVGIAWSAGSLAFDDAITKLQAVVDAAKGETP